jgi:hypothetical protein
MKHTRRDFITSFAMGIASLIISGCLSSQSAEDASHDGSDPTHPPLPTSMPTASASPANDSANSSEDVLRNSWLQLKKLSQVTQMDSNEGERLRDELMTNHRNALDGLVALNEISSEVANQIQHAFEQAAYHTWRVYAPAMCYEAMPPEAFPSGDLIQQANQLIELSNDLDPATVEKVQAAIARDMAFFEAISQDKNPYELLKQFNTDELEISPEALEAARFLMELLLSN